MAAGSGSGAARAWWLAAALASCAHAARGARATWPGCAIAQRDYEAVEVGKINDTVTELYLSYCDLTEINVDHLKCYPNLENLFLENNRISQIEAGIFGSFSKLHYLDLGTNLLLGRNLPANLFRNWHPISGSGPSIEFNGNDMNDTPADLLVGLDVYDLMLSNCSLREFPLFVKRGTFSSMFALHLKDNFISRLDDPETFANNVNLYMLFINNNAIEFLHADLLKPLSKIRVIYISNNRIRLIPDGFFHNKSSLSTVDLANNLIEHLSVDTFLGTNLGFLSLTGNRLTNLPVNFLSELQRTGVSLKVFYFSRNPWQCACLNEVLVEVNKLKTIYKGNKHQYINHLSEADDGRQPVCTLKVNDSYNCYRK